MKRKISYSQAIKKWDKLGKELSGVKVNKDPEKAKLELEALGIMARVKKEGISG
ncbi:MAG: hypothetical protein PHY56_00830 [Candidatus Omnitrophica bacterium]|nr:hypothetical protein [Candidatus Omnitrophota bacterium]